MNRITTTREMTADCERLRERLAIMGAEHQVPRELHVPRHSKVPDYWPVPACIAVALAIRYPREAGLAFMLGLFMVGASFAIAYAYYGLRQPRSAARRAWAMAAPFLAKALAWPLCGLALAIAWGIGLGRPTPIEPPLVLPPLPEMSYLEQRVLSERRVKEADKAMQHLHRVDRGCILGAGFGVAGGVALAIIITAIGA